MGNVTAALGDVVMLAGVGQTTAQVRNMRTTCDDLEYILQTLNPKISLSGRGAGTAGPGAGALAGGQGGQGPGALPETHRLLLH